MRPLSPVVLEVAHGQIQKLLIGAVDQESARQELETLGISALVDQPSPSDTPKSRSPVTKQGTGSRVQNYVRATKKKSAVLI